jgi:hypothetical protein
VVFLWICLVCFLSAVKAMRKLRDDERERWDSDEKAIKGDEKAMKNRTRKFIENDESYIKAM